MLFQYDFLTDVLSVVTAVLYAILIVIALRRSKFSERRRGQARGTDVVMHARWVEGPMLAALFTVALILLIARMLSDMGLYTTESMRLVAAGIRGSLFVAAVCLLVAYWRVRSTWR